MKKILSFLLAFLILELSIPASSAENKTPYGVFIGINPDEIDKLYQYEIIVIDADLFAKKDIEKLHKNGVTVYSYLNIGAIENFRSYYKKFKNLTLDEYENWDGEFWIDVSNTKWQKYVTNTLAKSLDDKNIDGFFLDNADVYYHFPTEKIYNGLKNILKGLEKYKLDVIINGGDTFVEKTLNDKNFSKNLFTGINQECVFTVIDFENNAYKNQEPNVIKYYKKYLELCKKSNLKVFLIEYSPNKKTKRIILDFCNKNSFTVFIAKSLELM